LSRCLASLATLLTAGLLAVGVCSAEASRGLRLGLTDSVFASEDAGARSFWLDRAAGAHADLILIAATWSSIAPSSRPLGFEARNPADPAYSWGALDAAVKSASARGLRVVILVNSAPRWAEGAHRRRRAPAGTWRPRPAALADFTHAIARRYSGDFPDPQALLERLPRIRHWQLWAEPNLDVYLNPQFKRRHPVGAVHYRRMLNAFYRELHAVRRSNVAITGGTAPYGDAPGRGRTRPLVFWRKVLCLKRSLRPAKCRRKPKLDVLAHNPINTSGGPRRSAINPDDVSTPDLGNLRRVLRAAERHHRVRPTGRHPIWATEIWWETNPPDRDLGVRPKRQARWLEQAFYVLWKAGAKAVVNFLIVDQAYDRSNPLGSFQSGLYFHDGSPKPALRAFSFPFVAERVSRRLVRVWGRSPRSGRLAIQARRRGRWRTLKSVKARRGSVFVTRLTSRKSLRLRGRVAGEQSLAWRAE
jgi:hypothetical protein